MHTTFPADPERSAGQALANGGRPAVARRIITALWLIPAAAIGVFALVFAAAHLFPTADQAQSVAATKEVPAADPSKRAAGDVPDDLAAIQSELANRQKQLGAAASGDLSRAAEDLIERTDAALALLTEVVSLDTPAAEKGQSVISTESATTDIHALRERLSALRSAR